MPLLKSQASWDNLVLAPMVANVRGAICMTCGRLVDFEGLVEGYPAIVDGDNPQPGSPRARYLVRHHGSEEARWFDMGSSNWDVGDLASMARRTNWFDPTAHEGLGLGQEIEPPIDDGPTEGST